MIVLVIAIALVILVTIVVAIKLPGNRLQAATGHSEKKEESLAVVPGEAFRNSL